MYPRVRIHRGRSISNGILNMSVVPGIQPKQGWLPTSLRCPVIQDGDASESRFGSGRFVTPLTLGQAVGAFSAFFVFLVEPLRRSLSSFSFSLRNFQDHDERFDDRTSVIRW